LTTASPRPFIHVVAGVVVDAAGRVLIAQRPAGKHMAGGWEFPGGKLEPGEERLAGLARELQEEIGITLTPPTRPLIRVRHTYPSREVLLDVWVVRSYSGEPCGFDGQALRWCTQSELAETELLPADKPIVAALLLPERLTQRSTQHFITGELKSWGHTDVGSVSSHETRLRGALCAGAAEAVAAAEAGAHFIVLREALLPSELAALCRSISVPVYARGIALEQAWALGSSGLNEICT
jgi:mutator protein MutT